MKNTILKLLFKQNLQLRKIRIDDFRESLVSPLQALFLAKGNKILLSIPIEKCRTQLWHSLEADKNPFVKTLISYSNGENNSFRESELERYYEEFQPKSAADVLRLPNNKLLNTLQPIEFIVPWENRSPKEIKGFRENITLKENQENELRVGLEAGYTEFGPITKDKAQVEFKRLIKIFNSIKRKGYREYLHSNDGAISGYFLKDGTKWCFIIKSGKHRSYALSALGIKNIPIVVDLSLASIVDKANWEYWAPIRENLFSKEDVDSFFLKILNL